jgi:hypothetical protein
VTLLLIGECTCCGTPNVGIRLSASGRVLAMCDECDAIWMDKALTDGPHFPQQPDLPCPGDGASLRNPPAHWATRLEAISAGWDDAIIQETAAYG